MGYITIFTERISIHALREEGDVGGAGRKPPKDISIHALREEGDEFSVEETLTRNPFLSTPSARRATPGDRRAHDPRTISIHALREEGDLFVCHLLILLCIFLSTPSARRAT